MPINSAWSFSQSQCQPGGAPPRAQREVRKVMSTHVMNVNRDAEGSRATRGLAGKFLVFQLGSEEFAIRVLSVREIIRMQDITRVPSTPPHVKGVINLRGKVIPVMDLRMKLGFPETGYDERTCIVIAEVRGVDEAMMLGTIVDAVCEVLNLESNDIQDTPDFGQTAPPAYLMGMAKTKGKIRILLDLDELLSTDELQKVGGLMGGEAAELSVLEQAPAMACVS
jgi:purine-binding chemotaxis protein CheW